ncbi:hypothetical protein AB0C95_23200 [Streptomyces caniferus]|uniref:hypothetical protein n=1 Tax=Streptomyces caniferus TaxID=285557 RepID=UPI0033EE6D38
MTGCAGYDFVILDTEHTLVDPQRLENLIRAAETTGPTPFVRVPEADPGAVLRTPWTPGRGASSSRTCGGARTSTPRSAPPATRPRVPWQVRHPRVQEAVRALRGARARHDVPFCAMSTTPERRAEWHADGVRAFVLGEDRDLTARALRGHRERTAGRG